MSSETEETYEKQYHESICLQLDRIAWLDCSRDGLRISTNGDDYGLFPWKAMTHSMEPFFVPWNAVAKFTVNQHPAPMKRSHFRMYRFYIKCSAQLLKPLRELLNTIADTSLDSTKVLEFEVQKMNAYDGDVLLQEMIDGGVFVKMGKCASWKLTNQSGGSKRGTIQDGLNQGSGFNLIGADRDCAFEFVVKSD